MSDEYIKNITQQQFLELVYKVSSGRYFNILTKIGKIKYMELYTSLKEDQQMHINKFAELPNHIPNEHQKCNPISVIHIDLSPMNTQEIFNILSAIEAAMKTIKMTPSSLMNTPFSKRQWNSIFQLLDKYYPKITDFIIEKTNATYTTEPLSDIYSKLGNDIIILVNSRDP